MTEENFHYHGVVGTLKTESNYANTWIWSYAVASADLSASGYDSYDSELAAYRAGLRAAHRAIDQVVGGEGGVFG